MADDLGLCSFWPAEQNFSYSMHYTKLEGDNSLWKTKANLDLQVREAIPSEEPHLELDDVLMLDDIREFTMSNGFTVSPESNFYGNDKLFDAEKSRLPVKENPLLEKQSSQLGTPIVKSPDEYLPSASDMSQSDTFQDLSIFMPQGSTVTAISTPSSSYSASVSFSDNSSSSSQFTNISYTDETSSVMKSSSISTNEPSTDNIGVTKCSETKVFKLARHRDIRRKNNIASQRSRMTRKEREREMENKERGLEQENQMLRIKIAKLEELTGALKKQLFRSVLGR